MEMTKAGGMETEGSSPMSSASLRLGTVKSKRRFGIGGWACLTKYRAAARTEWIFTFSQKEKDREITREKRPKNKEI